MGPSRSFRWDAVVGISFLEDAMHVMSVGVVVVAADVVVVVVTMMDRLVPGAIQLYPRCSNGPPRLPRPSQRRPFLVD